MPTRKTPRQCRSVGCVEPVEQDHLHCHEHHQRRQETWAAGQKDYRDRRKARTQLLERWAELLRDRIIPATAAAYAQNDLAMDAFERLHDAIVAGDTHATDMAYGDVADALNETRAALAAAHQTVMDMQRSTGPLEHVINPPPPKREARTTREARERQGPS